jgi:hypothetical protein
MGFRPPAGRAREKPATSLVGVAQSPTRPAAGTCIVVTRSSVAAREKAAVGQWSTAGVRPARRRLPRDVLQLPAQARQRACGEAGERGEKRESAWMILPYVRQGIEFSGFGGGQEACRKNTENRQQALDTRSSHVSNSGQSDERGTSGVLSNRLCVRSHPGRSGRPTSSAFPSVAPQAIC